ncbi:MAG: hybrid sensor histidine kinase/response regulator [Nitrospirota bacterium]|nr:MAG: hybrid sensor histidine kinase/response regulator [Nitrospirota bacterium]
MRDPSKILIVDDEFDIRLSLSTILEAHGYTTTTVSCAKEALDAVNLETPDLVLLDIRLPDQNGFDVCHQLREEPQTALLPVILVTAMNPYQEKVKGIEAGADDFLSKPINKAELLARVRSLLRIKELHDMAQSQAAHLAEWNRELEMRLTQESKLAEVARMLGDIAHEMKNLLMPVVTGTELLESELRDLHHDLSQLNSPSTQASHGRCNEIVEMVNSSGKRLRDHVKDLADCVKILSSEPQFSACRISKVVDQVFEPLRFSAREKGIGLRTEGLEDLPDIEADGRRLFHAFFNLVNNALSETPPGGFVNVKGILEPEGATVLLSFTDTGRGMPPEVRENLFTRQGLSTKQAGTGLGIKIIKAVVDAHSGHISVESQGGRGTTFYLRLPIHQTQETEETPA